MRKFVTVAALAVAMSGLAAPSAHAGLLVASAPSCAAQPLAQTFASFGDNSSYTPLPGGDFEPGSPSWTLSRAQVVSGNESFNVGGTGHSHSLSISPGGVATSPTICVGLEHPTMRFFAKSSGLLPVASVSVLTETSLGVVVELPLGVITPGSSWHPTPRYLVLANLLPLLPDNYTPVAFRLRAVTGTWSVDDVYVDPRKN
jgi:hypothetical protein